jgi:hypothetical protein
MRPLEERCGALLQRGRAVADVDGADGGLGAHAAVLAHPCVGAGVAEEVLLVATGELGRVTREGELEGVDGDAEADQGGGEVSGSSVRGRAQ